MILITPPVITPQGLLIESDWSVSMALCSYRFAQQDNQVKKINSPSSGDKSQGELPNCCIRELRTFGNPLIPLLHEKRLSVTQGKTPKSCVRIVASQTGTASAPSVASNPVLPNMHLRSKKRGQWFGEVLGRLNLGGLGEGDEMNAIVKCRARAGYSSHTSKAPTHRGSRGLGWIRCMRPMMFH